MSQEVDERVVEMRFDNAQFEKNVHQTMQSLEKLNDSLRLDGAEKGFEKIGDASAKVDFDEMQGALDDLSGKFSAVEVMGVAALSHITRQAIDTGERLVKSLSLDQVTSGWSKYAQKTASVQTIMNATGKSIAKVNGYLSKLMWFSDETSYSFTDMTQSLGQLTASGGDIEKVIPMIMGMANATAYAGKGASEFSRVIYNLNQSYSQGYLSLMDWKSVELAGVATAELKKQIIETGVALGKRHNESKVRLKQVVLRLLTVLGEEVQLATLAAGHLIGLVLQLVLGVQTRLNTARQVNFLLSV